ncbi:MAG: hypothetical protein ACE5GD_02355 [Candidatus Geothermarchaeales archaeon]
MNKKRGWLRERVIRVLLNHPDGSLTKYKLSKEAECSFSWTHEFLNKLETLGMVKGTKIKNYEELFQFWKKVYVGSEKKDYMVKKPLNVLRNTKLKYALTTYQAENLVQSYLFPSRVDFYIKKDQLNKWHELLTKGGLVGKGNVRILMSDDHVFYNSFKKGGLNLVSLPQLIVDLLWEGGVCVEAGEKLIKKVKLHAL